jgi:hypothetical protein
MARLSPVQIGLPLAPRGAGGAPHARGCECPRCEAGFAPSEGARAAAAREAEERRLREAAAAALARARERQRVKALKLALALEEGERQTAAYLRRQAQMAARVKRDPRLDALLASRGAGKPVADAIADAEARFRRGRQS